LLVAAFYACAEALGQMACSVPSPELKVSRDRNENSDAQPLPDVDMLSDLIEERLSLMTDVARAKWNSGGAIEDPAREQQLLADVGVKAQEFGISAEWAKHFFRFQMEAAKEVQYCLFAQWAAQRQGSFPQTPDLGTAIRPKLDQLTTELLQDLARRWPELRKRKGFEKNEPPCEQSTNESAIRLALLPLSDGSVESSGRVAPVKTAVNPTLSR
jgi:chorismate mutase-like protein